MTRGRAPRVEPRRTKCRRPSRAPSGSPARGGGPQAQLRPMRTRRRPTTARRRASAPNAAPPQTVRRTGARRPPSKREYAARSLAVIDMREGPDTLEKLCLEVGTGAVSQSGVPPQAGPGVTAPSQDVAEIHPRLFEERSADRCRHMSAAPPRSAATDWQSGTSDVLQHNGLGLSVHDDLSAGWKERKPLFDLALDAGPCRARQCPQLPVEAELLAVIANEVEHSQDGLVGGAS